MELMKNGLAKPAIIRIAEALSHVLIKFPQKKFIKEALDNIEKLELKERVQHLIEVMHNYLPNNFIQAASLLNDLKPHWNYGDADDPLRSFAAWPIIDYIAEYGIDHPVESLDVLKNLTDLFSAEFAIRPFIIAHFDYCQSQLLQWVNSDNEHIRRLVSEGTRPRLPWGMQLKCFIVDPSSNILLLEHLKNDDALYVRRSVANHLNDISKDHPDVVINLCKLWYKTANKNLLWLIKHATRTLIKSGHPDVFPLLGFTPKPLISITNFILSKDKIKEGEVINFSFNLQSLSNTVQELVIDFAIYFVKANNIQRAKVFKLKTLSLKTKMQITLNKNYSFKPISTRKYYSGEHAIEIIINGKPIAMHPFILTTENGSD